MQPKKKKNVWRIANCIRFFEDTDKISSHTVFRVLNGGTFWCSVQRKDYEWMVICNLSLSKRIEYRSEKETSTTNMGFYVPLLSSNLWGCAAKEKVISVSFRWIAFARGQRNWSVYKKKVLLKQEKCLEIGFYPNYKVHIFLLKKIKFAFYLPWIISFYLK